MWALARFCAPWVPDAGEKEKNALPKGRKALGLRGFGTTGRAWQPAKAFFSFPPGNCLRSKKRAKAHTPRRAAIPGLLIDVPPGRLRWGYPRRSSAVSIGGARRPHPQEPCTAEAGETAEGSRRGEWGRHGGLPVQSSDPGSPNSVRHYEAVSACFRVHCL